MNGDDSVPFPVEERSLEDELRSQFGSDVLVANDEDDHVASSEIPEDQPPEDEAMDEAYEDEEETGTYGNFGDLGPIDLTAPNAHSLSDSDDDQPENPLRRLIQPVSKEIQNDFTAFRFHKRSCLTLQKPTAQRFPTINVSESPLLPALTIVAESEDGKLYKVQAASPRGIVTVPMKVDLFTPLQDGNLTVLRADAVTVLE
jgi:hypothetical protein